MKLIILLLFALSIMNANNEMFFVQNEGQKQNDGGDQVDHRGARRAVPERVSGVQLAGDGAAAGDHQLATAVQLPSEQPHANEDNARIKQPW